MKKIFLASLFIVATFSSQTAFAWDGHGHRGGDDYRWSRPHSVYGGGWGNNYGGRHHGGNDDFLYGVLAGTIAGVMIAQPPPAYYSYPQPVYPVSPQRCWTEWRPVHGLYDQFRRQLGQNITVCERARW